MLFFSPRDLREKMNLLLEDSRLRDRLAENGREAVLGGHTLAHRAAQLVKTIEELRQEPQGGPGRARGQAALYLEGRALLMAGLRWPGKGGGQRVLAGASRLLAAAGDKDRPTPMAKWAGLAALVLGESDICLKNLQMASESGGGEEKLALALAAAQLGEAKTALQAASALKHYLGGLPAANAPNYLHLAAARIMTKLGQGIRPGFDGRRLPPALWSGLEHLIQACRMQPDNGLLWEELGDLLLAHRAPNEAHHFYELAETKNGSLGLREKLDRAAEEGYLRWARP